MTVGLNRAVALLAEPKRHRGPKVLKTLGEHPDDAKAVAILEGRYGPYVNHGSTNATLPGGTEPADITLEAALTLLAEREKKAGKKPKKPAAKKTKAKKPKAKKTKAKTKSAAKGKGKKVRAASKSTAKKAEPEPTPAADE